MNIKKVIITILVMSFNLSVYAQNKKTQDRNAIKKMCGCFEVEFNFAETFKYSSDRTYVPSKNYRSTGLKWAQLVDDKL
jgi:hypothetical protein